MYYYQIKYYITKEIISTEDGYDQMVNPQDNLTYPRFVRGQQQSSTILSKTEKRKAVSEI